MKWLVDEGVPKRLGPWLRDQGDDVLIVAQSKHRSQPDCALWRIAGEQERIVITRDRGFLCPSVTPFPRGVLVVRVPDDWTGAEIALFIWNGIHWLTPEVLVGHVTILGLRRTRQRPLTSLPGASAD